MNTDILMLELHANVFSSYIIILVPYVTIDFLKLFAILLQYFLGLNPSTQHINLDRKLKLELHIIKYTIFSILFLNIVS